jgi:putative membrane protein
MNHFGWYPFGGGWVGLLVVAAFIVLVAWGIAWLLRRDTHRYGAPPPPLAPPPARPPADPALQILRERFARGEINEAEFVAASRVLGAPEPPHGSPPDASA